MDYGMIGKCLNSAIQTQGNNAKALDTLINELSAAAAKQIELTAVRNILGISNPTAANMTTAMNALKTLNDKLGAANPATADMTTVMNALKTLSNKADTVQNISQKKPRTILQTVSISQGSTSAQTVVSLSGAGMLRRICWTSSNNSGAYNPIGAITIKSDGVVLNTMGVANAATGQTGTLYLNVNGQTLYWYGTDIAASTSPFIGNLNSYNVNLNWKFNSSLSIEKNSFSGGNSALNIYVLYDLEV